MLVGKPLALKNIAGSTHLLFLLPIWGKFHLESFFFCAGSLSYEYFSRICAKERGFLAEKHSLLFWAAHRLPIVWAVIVQCRCCLGSRLHAQHPQSYRSLPLSFPQQLNFSDTAGFWLQQSPWFQSRVVHKITSMAEHMILWSSYFC